MLEILGHWEENADRLDVKTYNVALSTLGKCGRYYYRCTLVHDVRECRDGQSGTQVDVVGTLQVLSFRMHCSVRIQNDIVHVKRSRGSLSCSRFGLVSGLASCLSRSEPDTGTVRAADGAMIQQ